MSETCQSPGCELLATVYFWGFDGRVLLSGRSFCESHMTVFSREFFASPASVRGHQSRLECALEFAVEAAVYDAQPATPENASGYVFLREAGESGAMRSFPFSCEASDAWRLRCSFGETGDLPPSPHSEMLGAIESLGGHLESAIIDGFDLRARAYSAKLRIVQNQKLLQLDFRPIHAVVLAVLADVPIFVTENVLRQTSDT
jgi:bifunctional DNase/RNase